jgi:predicted HicB family RNase H-like nuclease
VSSRLKTFEQRVTVSLPPRDHERLERLSREQEVSLSQLVRRAVREYLDRMPQPELEFDAMREPGRARA